MTASTPIRTAAVLSTTGLPTLKRDPLLAPGIVGLFDFSSDYVRQGKTTFAANDTFLNLVDGGGDAVALSAFESGIAGGGLVFDATNKSIRLPNNWRWPASQQRWGTIFWAKVDPNGYPAGGGVGVIGDSGSANQYWLGNVATGAGEVTTLNSGIGGAVLYAGSSQGVHQFGVMWELINGGSQRRVTIYNNLSRTALSTAAGGAMTAPTTDIVKIGQGAGDLANGFKGRFYRALTVDLDSYGDTFENLLVADNLGNAHRFA